MAGDPNWGSVVLAMHMDGADNSTTFTDSTGLNTVSVVSGPVISTTESKFGGTSGKFNGTGNLSVPHNTRLSLTSGDWTIEAWIWISAAPALKQSIINKDGVSGSSYPQYEIAIGTDLKIACFVGNGNGISQTGTSITSSSAISTSTWTHIALVKSGTTFKIYVAGTALASATAPPMYDGGKPLQVGFQTGGANGERFVGYVDDLRITKGVARYISNFTPPAATFVDYNSRLSGTVKDDTGTLCARTVRAYDRVTGALSGSAVSDAVTGVYTISTNSTNPHTVIALDDVSGTQYNALVLDNVMPE